MAAPRRAPANLARGIPVWPITRLVGGALLGPASGYAHSFAGSTVPMCQSPIVLPLLPAPRRALCIHREYGRGFAIGCGEAADWSCH